MITLNITLLLTMILMINLALEKVNTTEDTE